MDKLAQGKPRKSAPKSRAGCLTCKARHIRCGQQRPECDNCISTGRTCMGYSVPPDKKSPLPSLSRTAEQITTYTIPFKVPGSQGDRQMLHYYCCQAAWSICSYDDPTFWTHSIIHYAHDQPVVRGGLVALSSLHRIFVFDASQNTASNHLKADPETMAMVTKSYRQLRNYLTRADALPEIALICSIIFYFLEAMLGDAQKATSHLDSGLKLWNAMVSDNSSKTADMRAHIMPQLKRLDIQACTYDDVRLPMLELVSVAEKAGSESVVPDKFHDLSEAEAVLVKLQNWTLQNIYRGVEYKNQAAEEFPQDMLAERVVLSQQYQAFASALTHLGSYGEDEELKYLSVPTTQERRRLHQQRLLLVRIHLAMFTNLVEENIPISYAQTRNQHTKRQERLASNNYLLDAALDDISQLLSLPAISAMHSATSNHAESVRRSCTLSTGLIAMLYCLSLKTTCKYTLESACKLLSHPLIKGSRDGVWDARLVELVVRRTMDLRDHALSTTDPALRLVVPQTTLHVATDWSSEGEDAVLFSTSSPFYERSWSTSGLSSPDEWQGPVEVSDGSCAFRSQHYTRLDSCRLEDFAAGIVDVEGGIEEAARRISLLSFSMAPNASELSH